MTSTNTLGMVAHTGRWRAVQIGLALRSQGSVDKIGESYILKLLDTLEESKKALGDQVGSDGEMKMVAFAHEIFSKADDEDRAGNASKNTARTFFAAVQFFDVLRQFGELTPDVVEKEKYAKVKAAYISKCLKEGVTPIPGNGETEVETEGGIGIRQEENEDSKADPPSVSEVPVASEVPSISAAVNAADMHSEQAAVPPLGGYAAPVVVGEPEVFPLQPSVPVSSNINTTMNMNANTGIAGNSSLSDVQMNAGVPPSVGMPSFKAVQRAQQLCRIAISSMDFSDFPSAIQQLNEAIALIEMGKTIP